MEQHILRWRIQVEAVCEVPSIGNYIGITFEVTVAIVMAYVVMAHMIMAYVVMADVVMTFSECHRCRMRRGFFFGVAQANDTRGS